MVLGGGYDDSQFKNIKRCAFTYMAISILTLLRLLVKWLGGPDGDDDDEKDVASPTWGALYYVINRVLREQSAFDTPGAAYTEANQLTDVIPAGLNVLGDFSWMGIRKGIEAFDKN